MTRKLTVLSCTCILLVTAQAGFGAGFGLYEGSARGNALGGTLVGRADDPSALYFNPAGITQLEGINVMAGATAIIPSTDVTTMTPAGSVTTESEENVWVPPHLYGTYQVNDKVWAGVGVFSRFGLGSEFPEDWPGRYNSYNAEIQTLTLNPDVAFKVNDKLSLAAGVSATYFDLELDRKIPHDGQDLDMSLTGDSVGYGFNVAMRYKLLDWLAFGAAYQSEVKEEVEVDADIGVAKTDAEGDITLPDFIFLGLAAQATEKMSVEIGAVRTGWSSYDELVIDFDNPAVLGTSQSVTPKNWDDVWRYQAGIEYKLTEQFALRCGYVYDTEPITDESIDYLVPANDRQLYSIGCGYTVKDWTIDASYTYLVIQDRDVTARLEDGVLPGECKDGDTHMVGLSVSKKI